MPPVTKAGGSAFRKDVEFVAKDDDEQIAAGIVMVPDKADLQHDFVREDTIREFADQFEAFVEAGEAGGGVMHAVWPDDWMTLERNEVIDDPTEIGGTEAPAGAWIQEWRINHEELWDLVLDDILAGYSIGAIQVEWDGPFEQDDVENVAMPADLDEDALVWELVSGIIREVSAVDIPAVPDAQILETKADTEKRLGDYLGDPDGFVEEAMERGHSEAEAERLWGLLNDAVEADGSSEPGKQSMLAKAGKAFLSALTGTDDDATSEDQDHGAIIAETSDTGPRDDRGRDKEGRTLSQSNRHSLYATIDASLDILQDAGVDHGMTRFTDRDDTAFDLSEHTAREWTSDEDEDEDEEDGFWELAVEDGIEGYQHSETGEFVSVEEADADIMADIRENETPTNNAAGGDTPDDTTTMSNENTDDPWDDAPEWAKDLRDTQEEHSKQIDEIASEKAGSDKETDVWEDAPEWAKDLKDEQEKNAERIDAISKQTGTSTQQLGKGAGEENGEKDTGFTLDPRKAKR